jgi:hypothetical protein
MGCSQACCSWSIAELLSEPRLLSCPKELRASVVGPICLGLAMEAAGFVGAVPSLQTVVDLPKLGLEQELLALLVYPIYRVWAVVRPEAIGVRAVPRATRAMAKPQVDCRTAEVSQALAVPTAVARAAEEVADPTATATVARADPKACC